MKILIKYTDQEGHQEEIKWAIEAQNLCCPRGLARPHPRMCTPSQPPPLPPSRGAFFLPGLGLSAPPPDSLGTFSADRRPLALFFLRLSRSERWHTNGRLQRAESRPRRKALPRWAVRHCGSRPGEVPLWQLAASGRPERRASAARRGRLRRATALWRSSTASPP